MNNFDRSSDESQGNCFFSLSSGYRLPASELSITISVDETTPVEQPRHLTVRVLTPDEVVGAYTDLVHNHIVDPYQMVLDYLGNPNPNSEDFWKVRDWVKLLNFSHHIDLHILRHQPVCLDQDVIYTKHGANITKGTIVDSRPRLLIEKEWKRTGSQKRYWSPSLHAIQAYYENMRGLVGYIGDDIEKYATVWGLLREVASASGILEQDENELFGKASFSPFPLFIPFTDEEAWRWRCEELDALDEFEEFLDNTQREAIEKQVLDLRESLADLPLDTRQQKETIIKKLEQLLSLSDDDSSVVDDYLLEEVEKVKDQCYRLVWADAYEINMREHGGDTVPLAQSLEFEMLSVKHAMLGIICRQVYQQIKQQMTREEQRLFLAMYTPNPFTWDYVPAFLQTVIDFIRSASETVLGLGLLVWCGYKQIGGENLGEEFMGYWKTWLWICDLARSGKIDEIAQVLNQEPTFRHQFKGKPVYEISFDTQEHQDLIESIAMPNDGCGMFQEEAILAGELNIEEDICRRVLGKNPAILARLINEYTTEPQKQVLLLRYFHPEDRIITQKELAAQLHISQPAVNQRLNAGLKAIRLGMENEEKQGLLHWQELI